ILRLRAVTEFMAVLRQHTESMVKLRIVEYVVVPLLTTLESSLLTDVTVFVDTEPVDMEGVFKLRVLTESADVQ
ncbi:MAG TPA: hypothetical protein VMZ04_03765, partial [Anaerolineae bacterium]|nr:hypothetical protein [Anaerolineae bacterium]